MGDQVERLGRRVIEPLAKEDRANCLKASIHTAELQMFILRWQVLKVLGA